MNKRTVSGSIGMIVILLAQASISPLHLVSALEKLSTVVVTLASGSPYFLGEMNGELYYKFQSHLWKSDGTATGTILVNTVDPLGPHITPGAGPLSAKHYPKGSSTNGLFFFAANDGTHGYELWRSDGTMAGTYMVEDIYPGDASSNPENMIAVSNLVFFTISADDCYSSPCELWRSDGTPEGTFFLTSIQMPPYAVPLNRLESANVNGFLLFSMYDVNTGAASAIWRSDGTVNGTSELITGADFLVASDGKLFFSTRNDRHLWVTDGTGAGTVSLTDFPVDYLKCIHGICYFSESTPAMWTTDGTPGGTYKLADIPLEDTSEFAAANGTVFFSYADQLWKTDNTPAGTLLIQDGLSTRQLTIAYGQLFFINADNQLWKSDGTTAGTMMVTNFENSQKLSEIVVVNEKLFLKVEEPPVIPVDDYIGTQDWHLYKSDGTQTGTQRIGDFAQVAIQCPTPLCWAGILVPINSTVIEGKWFFEALDHVSYTPKLWLVTDVFFQDVAPDHWAFPWVEKLAETGVTAGCNPTHYCPDEPVNRAQIAVLLEKGMHYPEPFTPPDVAPTFIDIAGHWAEDWIEALRSDGITGGCGTNLYCPEDPVTRAQMAVFLLKSKHGSSYTPPVVGASTGFSDVPVTHWAAPWIKQLAVEGITGGCRAGIYCPESPVTRAQMAVFLVKTFSLP